MKRMTSFRIDHDLVEVLKELARQSRQSMSAVLTRFLMKEKLKLNKNKEEKNEQT